MTGAGPLQAEAEPMQVVQPPLRRHPAPQVVRHPGGNLPSVPQPSVLRSIFQSRSQRRQARCIQQRVRTVIAPAPVPKAIKAGRIPAVDQFADPPLRETRHTGHLRCRVPFQKSPDHLQMRPPNRIPLTTVGITHFRSRNMTLQYFPLAHQVSPHILWAQPKVNHKTNESIKRNAYKHNFTSSSPGLTR